jgi:hypothetical protein
MQTHNAPKIRAHLLGADAGQARSTTWPLRSARARRPTPDVTKSGQH